MKKIIQILMVFLALTVAVNAFPGEGLGTPEDPYRISNLTELNATRLDLSAHYQLVNDINASETQEWNAEKGFRPIGNNTDRFTGSFNGAGHTIEDLHIDRPEEDYIGLFGYVSNGEVKNIGIEANLSGKKWVGALAGYNHGDITNSSFRGEVKGDEGVGGIAGGVGEGFDDDVWEVHYDGDYVYFGTNEGELIKVNAEHGYIEWQTTLSSGDSIHSIYAYGDELYIGAFYSPIYVVSSSDGEVKDTIGYPASSSSTVEDIYVDSDYMYIVRNYHNSWSIWMSDDGGDSWDKNDADRAKGFVRDGGSLYSYGGNQHGDPQMHRIEIGSLEYEWQKTGSQHRHGIHASNGSVYTASWSTIYEYDAVDGSYIGEFYDGSSSTRHFDGDDEFLYVAERYNVRAFNLTNGNELWLDDYEDRIMSISFDDVNKEVYVGSQGPRLVKYSHTGEILWSIPNAGDIKDSYVVGDVNGNEFVGGIVGEHRKGLIEDNYAITNVSGNNNIGGIAGRNRDRIIDSLVSQGSSDNLVGVQEGNLIGRTTFASKMDMKNANLYMENFKDYPTLDEPWNMEILEAEENKYPQLSWEKNSEESAWIIDQTAFFQVKVENHTVFDEELQIEANVTNTGHFDGEKHVNLTIENDIDPIKYSESVFLEKEETKTVTFDIAEEDIPEKSGEYTINVSTEDHHDAASLLVVSAEIRDWYDLYSMRYELNHDYTLMNDLNKTTDGYGELASNEANAKEKFEDEYLGTASEEQFQTGYYPIEENQLTIYIQDYGEAPENDYEVNGDAGEITFEEPPMDLYEGVSGWYDITADYNLSEKHIFGWEPIGELDPWENLEFSGFLNGQNHTISDLYINRPQESEVGLFGAIDQINGLNGLRTASYEDMGEIKNVKLENINITGGNSVGSLVGANLGSKISNSHVTKGKIEGDWYVGGLIGIQRGLGGGMTPTPRSLDQEMNTQSEEQLEPGIYNSSADIKIIGDNFVGGLVGSNQYTIKSSYATGNVEAQEGNAGGLVGQNGMIMAGPIIGSVENEVQTQDVPSEFSGPIITNSYATGDVEAQEAGGLVGANVGPSLIQNSYSRGKVQGSLSGGLIGNNTNALVRNSFWDEETSNQDEGIGYSDSEVSPHPEWLTWINKKNTTEMQQIETYQPRKGEKTYKQSAVEGELTVTEIEPFIIGIVQEDHINTTENEATITLADAGLVSTGMEEPEELNLSTGENETAEMTAGNITITLNEVINETTVNITTEYEITGWSIEMTEEQKNDRYPFLSWQTGNSPTWYISEEPENHTLNISIEGQGTVDKEPDQEEYEYGTEVNLTAEPNEGYQFTKWTGDYTGTDEEITITMDEDKQITANFKSEEVTPTPTPAPGYSLMSILILFLSAIAIYGVKINKK